MIGETFQDKENINTKYINQGQNDQAALKKDISEKKPHQVINVKKRPPSTPLTPSLMNQNVLKKNKIDDDNNAANDQSHKKNLSNVLIDIINEEKQANNSTSFINNNQNLMVINETESRRAGTSDSRTTDSIFITKTRSNIPKHDHAINSNMSNINDIKDNSNSNIFNKSDLSLSQGNDTVIRYEQAEKGNASTHQGNISTNISIDKDTRNKSEKIGAKTNSYKLFNDDIDFELMKVNYEINELIMLKKLNENSQLIQFLKLERMFEHHYNK